MPVTPITEENSDWFGDAWEFIGHYLDNRWLHMDKSIPGFSLAVFYEGKVYTYCAGDAYKGDSIGENKVDESTAVKMRADHMFRCSSQTKTITAMAVMKLVQDGKIKLDDSAGKYLEEFYQNPYPGINTIIVQDLLSHRSSIARDMGMGLWDLSKPFPTVEQMLEHLAVEPPVFLENEKNHDSRFMYSNYGFALLGLIVEKATGMTFEEYVTENIIGPLGLEGEITFVYSGKDKEKYVADYSLPIAEYAEQLPLAPTVVDPKGYMPAIGIRGTPSAMAKLFSAMMPGNEKILSDEIKKEMLSPESSAVDRYENYGLGIFKVKNEKDGNVYYGHAGANPLGTGSTLIDPNTDAIVSVGMNASADTVSLSEDIHKILSFFKKHPKRSKEFGHYDKLRFCSTDTINHYLIAREGMELDEQPIDMLLVSLNDADPFANGWRRGLAKHPDDPSFSLVAPESNDYVARGGEVSFVKSEEGPIILNLTGSPLLPPELYKKHLERLRAEYPYGEQKPEPNNDNRAGGKATPSAREGNSSWITRVTESKKGSLRESAAQSQLNEQNNPLRKGAETTLEDDKTDELKRSRLIIEGPTNIVGSVQLIINYKRYQVHYGAIMSFWREELKKQIPRKAEQTYKEYDSHISSLVQRVLNHKEKCLDRGERFGPETAEEQKALSEVWKETVRILTKREQLMDSVESRLKNAKVIPDRYLRDMRYTTKITRIAELLLNDDIDGIKRAELDREVDLNLDYEILRKIVRIAREDVARHRRNDQSLTTGVRSASR